jgi:quercetin dioxygenase-like cupin family protein
MQALNILSNQKFEGVRGTKVPVVKSDQLAVDALYLRAGESTQPQRLPERDRTVVVIAGTGELVMNGDVVDQRIELAPGVVALAPRGVWHSVRNLGTDALVCALATQFPVRVENQG